MNNIYRSELKEEKKKQVTKVMTPIRSNSLLGLREMHLGVEWPELGGDTLKDEPAHSDGGMELKEWKRPPRPSSAPTRHSISSARMAVFSFSSWIILWGQGGESEYVQKHKDYTNILILIII